MATIELTGTVDVGQGGNTVTNVTTAAIGDQVDPSTVGDDLTESVVIENLADLVTEKTLLSGNPTPLEGEQLPSRSLSPTTVPLRQLACH